MRIDARNDVQPGEEIYIKNTFKNVVYRCGRLVLKKSQVEAVRTWDYNQGALGFLRMGIFTEHWFRGWKQLEGRDWSSTAAVINGAINVQIFAFDLNASQSWTKPQEVNSKDFCHLGQKSKRWNSTPPPPKLPKTEQAMSGCVRFIITITQQSEHRHNHRNTIIIVTIPPKKLLQQHATNPNSTGNHVF